MNDNNNNFFSFSSKIFLTIRFFFLSKVQKSETERWTFLAKCCRPTETFHVGDEKQFHFLSLSLSLSRTLAITLPEILIIIASSENDEETEMRYCECVCVRERERDSKSFNQKVIFKRQLFFIKEFWSKISINFILRVYFIKLFSNTNINLEFLINCGYLKHRPLERRGFCLTLVSRWRTRFCSSSSWANHMGNHSIGSLCT